MQQNNKHSVSGQELDNLLKQAFLNLDGHNPKNMDIMETVANTTFSKPLPPAGSKFFSLKWIIAFTGIISVIVITSLYFFAFKPADKPSSQVYSFDEAIVSGEQKPSSHTTEQSLNPVAKDMDSISVQTTKKLPVMASVIPITLPQTNEKPSVASVIVEQKKPKDTAYVFPILTDEEIKANKKRKEKMIQQSLKFSKDKYTSISRGSKNTSAYHPSRKIPYGGSYIQTTEVSNIEYKTFLFDLLIRGDKGGFLAAKPDQSLWNTIYDPKLGKYYEDHYFSDKRYNDHPVVNVSRHGAELYCQWLQAETEQAAIEKNVSFIRTYALPDDQEWGYAAQGGKGDVDYPWGGPYVRNPNGIYLANICLQKSPDKLEPARNMEYTAAGMAVKDPQVLTASVISFTVNNYGLYHMSGNVAEFVTDRQTKRLLLKGGSWNGSLEEARIDPTEQAKGTGASPYNGFRIMINETDPWMIFSHQDAKDTDFVFPKPTKTEVKEHQARKQKMIRQLLSFQKDKYAFIPMGSCFYQKQTVSAQAFYLYTTEVTNAEYKTFVMDLWINGKKEAFLKHIPDQKQWTKKIDNKFLEAMEHMYFSHPAYDDYPVVNVSREDAEAYCLWLTTEANKQQEAEGKTPINDVRLPSDVEWALAASNKKNSVKYANGLDSLRDAKGKYTANYSGVSYAKASYDSLKDIYLFKINKGEPGFISDGAFYTSTIKSYTPNVYGIYNMAGNVSEMVYLWNTTTNKAKGFGSKGGNWFSTDHFLEIDAAQEFKHPEKPSPLVGFRPVVTAVIINKTER